MLSICISVLAIALSDPPLPPWRNHTLPWPDRVQNMLDLLTTYEKAQLMGKASPAIERLGIESYNFRQGTPQQCNSGYKTAMPQNLGVAASFNVSNAFISGHVTGVEFRSDHMDYTKGLTCYGPMANIMRSPLWGRNHEGYGEDPFLSSQMVYQMVVGLQGDDEKYVQVHADCKHFSTFDGPGNGGSAWISDRDWFSTYLPSMKACVAAKTVSFMCSYAQLNGVYGCNNHRALTEILRDTWGFDGFVVSDMGALHGAVQGVTAGCDLEDGYGTYIQLANMSETNTSLLHYIDQAVGRLLTARMKLGEWDPADVVPFANPTVYNQSRIQSPAFMKHAKDASVQTIALLKNAANTLPFDATKIGKLAVLGPGGNTNHHPTYGPAVTSTAKTVFTAFQAAIGDTNVAFESGCDSTMCANYNASGVAAVLHGATTAVIVLSGYELENEGHDRTSYELPGQTQDLVMDVINAHIPFVVVFGSADPFNITGIISDVPAIVQSFYPQEYNGEAVVDVLLGMYNPAARSPFTWPRVLYPNATIGDYTMAGKTYRYGEDSDALFSFGYGLSYTSFSYSKLIVPTTTPTCGAINVSVVVTNVGNHDGHEVVQVYVTFLNSPFATPKLQLSAFQRVFLSAGASTTVHLTINPQQSAVLNASDDVPGGHHPHPSPSPPSPCTNPCCRAVPNVMIVGDQDEVQASDADACCLACSTRPSCQGFTFSDKGCWLKTSVNNTKPDPTHTSGVIVKREGCGSTTTPHSTTAPPTPKTFMPQWLSVPVQLELNVGGQQPHQTTMAPSNVLTATVEITGNPQPLDLCNNTDNEYPHVVAPAV
eukprot:m.158511 g.158511  ORF g.158511 m.158511 type:complete len:823 (-) comp31092_c0_seq2:18-2486(-)